MVMCCDDIKILPLFGVSSFSVTSEDWVVIGSMVDVMIGSMIDVIIGSMVDFIVDFMVDFTVVSNTGSLLFAEINCHIYYYKKRNIVISYVYVYVSEGRYNSFLSFGLI